MGGLNHRLDDPFRQFQLEQRCADVRFGGWTDQCGRDYIDRKFDDWRGSLDDVIIKRRMDEKRKAADARNG